MKHLLIILFTTLINVTGYTQQQHITSYSYFISSENPEPIKMSSSVIFNKDNNPLQYEVRMGNKVFEFIRISDIKREITPDSHTAYSYFIAMLKNTNNKVTFVIYDKKFYGVAIIEGDNITTLYDNE